MSVAATGEGRMGPSVGALLLGKRTLITLQIEHFAVDSLHPDPANPRRISESELETLTRSIQQFGLVDPIIARHDDRIVPTSRN